VCPTLKAHSLDSTRSNFPLCPSRFRNPRNCSSNLVSQYVVLYDKTFTGYSSCDLYHGNPDASKPDDNKCDGTVVTSDCKYHCVCAHERQPITAPCDQEAVGYVELKDYYNNRKQGGAAHPVVDRIVSKLRRSDNITMFGSKSGRNESGRAGGQPNGQCSFPTDPNIAKVCPKTEACNEIYECEPHGVCSWFDNAPPGGAGTMNNCQLNFGRKLASSQASFNWCV
jgi:hypothetical protein